MCIVKWRWRQFAGQDSIKFGSYVTQSEFDGLRPSTARPPHTIAGERPIIVDETLKNYQKCDPIRELKILFVQLWLYLI